MDYSYVGVKTFRNQIDFAIDAVNRHWPACVDKKEQVTWFLCAIKRFSDLSQTRCRRATETDLCDFNNAFDLFSGHCERNFMVWSEARLKLGIITPEQFSLLESLNQTKPKLVAVH